MQHVAKLVTSLLAVGTLTHQLSLFPHSIAQRCQRDFITHHISGLTDAPFVSTRLPTVARAAVAPVVALVAASVAAMVVVAEVVAATAWVVMAAAMVRRPNSYHCRY